MGRIKGVGTLRSRLPEYNGMVVWLLGYEHGYYWVRTMDGVEFCWPENLIDDCNQTS